MTNFRQRFPADICGESVVEGDAGPTTGQVKGRGARGIYAQTDLMTLDQE